jgi:hypothetical protein
MTMLNIKGLRIVNSEGTANAIRYTIDAEGIDI